MRPGRGFPFTHQALHWVRAGSRQQDNPGHLVLPRGSLESLAERRKQINQKAGLCDAISLQSVQGEGGMQGEGSLPLGQEGAP